ncbi:MAG TPA: MerR family transcriptional regulator [Bacteroidales bacterium]|nr:MerR family transcriptional regulator [Bacteroidales bacterium]HRW84444.1 MerR family transcriptional regulator [Bacteroidales bacterium]
MGKYTLNDLENLTGIRADTIRIWEMRYGIIEPQRTATGRRWYTDADLIRLMNIALLNNEGIKISKIANLTSAEIKEKVSAATGGKNKPADTFVKLITAMNKLDEEAVDDTINKEIASLGVERTYKRILFPFLKNIGILWQTGAIDPGTEHFITAILRKHLISASPGIAGQGSKKRRKYLLFLPEGEWHELALLYFNYVLLKKGYKTLYLGQSTPLSSVISAAETWKPDTVITGTLSGLAVSDASEFLLKMHRELKVKKILVAGGLAADAEKLKLPDIKPLINERSLN